MGIKYEDDDFEESLDISDEEEEETMTRFLVKLALIFGGTLLAVIALIFLYFNYGGGGIKPAPTQQEERIDVSLIPTYEVAEVVLGRAWDNIIGIEFDKFFDEYEVDGGDYFRIPSTNTFMDNRAATGVMEHLALIQVAYQKNPFLIDENTPNAFAQFDDPVYGESITLADGTEIDMRGIEQIYSEMRVHVNPTNPLQYAITGYVDGGYFEEEVDLQQMYVDYAN